MELQLMFKPTERKVFEINAKGIFEITFANAISFITGKWSKLVYEPEPKFVKNLCKDVDGRSKTQMLNLIHQMRMDGIES